MPRRHLKHRPPQTKSVSERIHAQRRALERYKLSLTVEDLQRISRQIRTRKDVLFISKQSLRVSRWKVVYQDTTMYVVYDKLRRSIVTFLSPEMI